jgi:hypothetical protein
MVEQEILVQFRVIRSSQRRTTHMTSSHSPSSTIPAAALKFEHADQ